jgi:ketosteroid isomerase-like protein
MARHEWEIGDRDGRSSLRAGRILVCSGLLALCALALPAPAQGSHPRHKQDSKHQVEKLEETWRMAQLNGDVEAMDRLLSDDYVGITMSGQVVTKMQQLDRMRSRTVELTRIELSDVKVKLIGSTAIITSLAAVEGTADGQPMHGNYRYTRVYSRLPSGGWKITNFEATRVGEPGANGRRPPRGDTPSASGHIPGPGTGPAHP